MISPHQTTILDIQKTVKQLRSRKFGAAELKIRKIILENQRRIDQATKIKLGISKKDLFIQPTRTELRQQGSTT